MFVEPQPKAMIGQKGAVALSKAQIANNYKEPAKRVHVTIGNIA
jgi:hypothetical protein